MTEKSNLGSRAFWFVRQGALLVRPVRLYGLEPLTLSTATISSASVRSVNPSIAAMALTKRRILLYVLLTFSVLHEPALKILINLLVNAHIFSRISLDIVRTLVDAHFPAVAHVTSTVFYELRAFMSHRYEWAMIGLASWIRTGLLHLMYWTTIWLGESSRWLCELNEFIIETGEYLVWKLQGYPDEKVVGNWLVAEGTVAQFCAKVRGGHV